MIWTSYPKEMIPPPQKKENMKNQNGKKRCALAVCLYDLFLSLMIAIIIYIQKALLEILEYGTVGLVDY